jgi:acylphosphatase
MNMMLMKKVILHISGNVQQAGYRAKVMAIANVLDIKGNVQNLTDGRVKIVAEGEEADLERFIKGVNIKNTLINVSDIAKEYSHPTGDYERFYKLVGDGETDERLDTAADLLKELIDVSKSGFDDLGGKINHLGDNLGGKINQLGDNLGGKIDQSRIEITSEIRTSREDLSSHFDERISMIEHDLAQIKAKVMM